jgi:predicted aldo/keto reductase-like oxidoreductase
MPCPNGVAIPHIFALYNDASVHDTKQVCSFRYSKVTINEDQRADNCVECGECVEKCPQNIDIPAWLKKAHEFLYITD